MKNTTLYITTIAACGLYIASAMAQETAAPVQEASQEVAAENTTTVYIVKFKGDG